MRKFVIATSAATLLLTGIATATADPVAPAAAAQPATDITGSFDPTTLPGSVSGLAALGSSSLNTALGNPSATLTAGIPAGSQASILIAPFALGYIALCTISAAPLPICTAGSDNAL